VSRSFLFVPGDSPAKLKKAAESAADALIIDLEDSVAPSARPGARELVADFLQEPRRPDCWVRINPLDGEDWRRDLEAIVPAAPYGVVLPKASGGEDMRMLSAALDAQEDACGDGCGITRIMPIVTEKPAALFRLHEYAGSSSRLAGMTWGAEDLSAALGASRNRDASGEWLPPYQLARSLTLIAAAAASVPAIDTVFTDFRDSRGLAEYAERARQDGFDGMLAIHPSQLTPINAAFQPSADEIKRARRIVELFAEQPEQGVLQLDGAMIDRPHLIQARRILDLAARSDAR
jgi:citrate lyase subunit beta/citryl-CoA lyase